MSNRQSRPKPQGKSSLAAGSAPAPASKTAPDAATPVTSAAPAAPATRPAPEAGASPAPASSASPDTAAWPHCVEHGVWVSLPSAPPREPRQFTLRLRDVHPREHDRIKQTGAMTFHLTGCAGDFGDHAPQLAVARVLAEQARDPSVGAATKSPARRSSFLYHLGDIVYKDEDKKDVAGDNQREMYNSQFYAPYTHYPRRIFAIAGNHDGKVANNAATCAVEHFMANFCALAGRAGKRSLDNDTDQRAAMIQPYPYWRLTTPLAYIIGLYTNIANGGMLDDPAHPGAHPQYDWLVAQLKDTQRRNVHHTPRKAVLLTLHYPPYSGTSNFAQRGDPTLGPSNARSALPLAEVLQQAFKDSGQRPDAVFSAHTHLYQRLTLRYADGWELPFLIVGSGGHGPVESMWKECDKSEGTARQAPFDAVLPPGHTLPTGQSARVVAFDDQSFGMLRATIADRKLTGEFFAASPGPVKLVDAFTLDLDKHTIR